jgi:cytochrome P450
MRRQLIDLTHVLHRSVESTVVFRNPLEPVTIDGVEIGTTDYINVILGSANRDPAVFENPDSFDIFREQNRHYAFGQGAHVCIGQHLARMEMIVAVNTLLDRLPNLRLDPDFPKPEIHGLILRGPDALNVLFD